MDFWETVWLLFTCFALVTYLIVVFAVIRGVLRDDIPGWEKAAWLIALIFVPFLTAVVYVIIRGTAGELTWGDGGQAQGQQAQYERSTPGPSPTQEIAHAKSMWDTGVIDHAEFNALKMKALS